MTREEAIAVLQKIKPIPCRADNKSLTHILQTIALDMAIKALKQEPCEDAVSREELLKAIDTWDKFGYTETGCFVREPKGDYVPYIHYDDVVKAIKGMPSVQPKAKTGHWLYSGENGADRWTCDNCFDFVKKPTKVCPNCGAEMKGGE